uniref:HTH CENPB-type domain-containing protein n=1 Tax=Schizaphis graminum TaxID=13262 RepID=A0A2S2NRC0_SCHGA
MTIIGVVQLSIEKCFTSHIKFMSEYGFLVDKTDIRYIVKSYLDRLGKKVNTLKNNLPGLSWVSNFLKRNKPLSYRFATNIKTSRAATNEDIIRSIYNKYSINV